MGNEEHLPCQPSLPWLVFPHGDEQTFYDVIHQRSVQRSIPWLRRSVCRAAAYGWLLLQDLDSHGLSLFHPTTSRRIFLPKTETEIDNQFICRFSSPPDCPDCRLIAIHKYDDFFFYYQLSWTHWKKYELNLSNEVIDVQDIVVCSGKIYALAWPQKLVVIDLVSCPRVICLQAKLSLLDYRRCPRYYNLVESCGDLYLVERYSYGSDSLFRTVVVYKMSFSCHCWRVVRSIEDRVFALGQHYSMSFSASNAGVKGNFIHFSFLYGVFYSFNLEGRSLTVDFPCRDMDDDLNPCWLWLDQPVVKQARSFLEIGEGQSNGGLPYSEELQRIDYPKPLLTYSLRDQHPGREAAPPTLSPRTPWLMFTLGYDGIFKFLDPCSNKVYELYIPELSDTQIWSSRDGWLLIFGKSVFFFNPFTKKRIDLPFLEKKYGLFGVTFSSCPTSADCVVFCIRGYDGGVGIYLFRFGNDAWTFRTYTNDLPYEPSNNSPIYHNGLFYCLGLDGYLGIFDPIADTWSVIDTCLSFDVPISKWFLVNSDGELLSVYFDLYENLIGVFTLDFSRGRWEKVTHLGDRTLFVGMEASFSVAAAEQRMVNKIYLPKFHGEHNFDLVFHDIGVENSYEACKTTEYLHIWIEPKDVAFGLT